MTHESPKDPRRVWQSQAREHPIISVEDVRVRAQVVRRKVRRNLTIAFALGLALLFLCVLFIANSTSYTATGLIAAAIMTLTVVVGYQSYSRMWSPNILSPDAALKGCLDFYRNELQAQHRSVALTWRFLGPLVIFAFLTWNMVLTTPSLLPRVLLSAVLVLALFLRRREVRKLKSTLSLLDEFEKEE